MGKTTVRMPTFQFTMGLSGQCIYCSALWWRQLEIQFFQTIERLKVFFWPISQTSFPVGCGLGHGALILRNSFQEKDGKLQDGLTSDN